ncbi:MAG: LD-carboxypeptidase, partial [Bacteroidota bacterium]
TSTTGFALENVTDTPFNGLQEGEATGPLLGGNLAVLSRLIGTPYLPDLRGALLFLEDINEPAYKIDAMLGQLKLSGIWENLGGLIIGQFTDEANPEHTPAEIDEVFRDYCNNVTFPVASGLRYGHIPVKNSMPVGVKARLRVTSARTEIQVLEPLVAQNNRQSANRTQP